MELTATQLRSLSDKNMAEVVEDDILIGKDILELLAGAMYTDPLSIYREYMQNAADSVDDARQVGLMHGNNDSDVSIEFDHVGRTVLIRDFGFGIPSSQFAKRLTSVGGSRKRGKGQRGFRGIGRLSGLGYCQELVFRSRAAGQAEVLEMCWNGRVLRDRLRDTEFNGELGDLIREVVTITRLSGAGFPEHFFDVELRKVLRIKNDVLMNEEAVRTYLSQVAPVPFHPDFQYGQEIQAWLSERGVKAPVQIEINDGRGLVYHRVINTICFAPNVTDEFDGVEFLEYRNSDDELLAFGWILEHDYLGAVPRRSGLSGIRLRSGDIQVGDELILASLFPENRFASWCVGDLHVVHPRILPNGRRDEFEPSPQYAQLQEEVRILSRDITKIIRARSDQRNKVRRLHLQLIYADTWLNVAGKESLPKIIRVLSVERASNFAKLAATEYEKLAPFHNEMDAVGDLIGRTQYQAAFLKQKLTSMDGFSSPHKEGKDSIIKAAICAILNSAYKPDAVIPLAESVLSAMLSH